MPSTERSHLVESGPRGHRVVGLSTAPDLPIKPSEETETKDGEGLKQRTSHVPEEEGREDSKPTVVEKQLPTTGTGHVSFSTDTFRPREKALRIPGPREFEAGHRAHEVDEEADGNLL